MRKQKTENRKKNTRRGFTLIETMVAITLLTVAITAPMTLATQSLSTAYYARDQIAAFHLAQEAIESVRHIRDGNVLYNSLGFTPTHNLLYTNSDPIPTDGTDFAIDTGDDSIISCSGGCPVLKTNGELFGYSSDSGWTDTKYTRSVKATFVDALNNEIHVEVTVEWQTARFNTPRKFTISENIYRWVEDGSAAQ